MNIFKHRDYYYLSYSDQNNQRKRISTKTKNYAEAKIFLKEFKEGIYPKRKNKNRLQPIIEQFLKYSQVNHAPNTFYTYTSVLKDFEKHFRGYLIQKISSRELENYVLDKTSRVSAYTGKKYYRHCSCFFEKAISWEYLNINPFKKFKAPRIPEKMPAYFSVEEIKKLLSVIKDGDLIKDIVLFALYTGMRQAEIYNLRWIDIDFINRVVKIQNSEHFTTKNKRIRFIPMNEEVYKLLLNRQSNKILGNEIVFYSQELSYKSLRHYITHKFKEYVRTANLNDALHFHSLRHTFASWLVQRDTNIFAVMKLLGHSTIATTMIYTHLSPETLHSEVNKLSILN